jgi:hypothetical protein
MRKEFLKCDQRQKALRKQSIEVTLEKCQNFYMTQNPSETKEQK